MAPPLDTGVHIMKLPSTSDLARISAAHPWRVLAVWILALVLAVATMGVLGDSTTTEMRFTNNPEAQQGMDILERAGLDDNNPTDETVIVQAKIATVDDPAYREHVQQVTADLRALKGVVVSDTVVNYYELSANSETAAMAEGLVSEDRRTTLIPLT